MRKRYVAMEVCKSIFNSPLSESLTSRVHVLLLAGLTCRSEVYHFAHEGIVNRKFVHIVTVPNGGASAEDDGVNALSVNAVVLEVVAFETGERNRDHENGELRLTPSPYLGLDRRIEGTANIVIGRFRRSDVVMTPKESVKRFRVFDVNLAPQFLPELLVLSNRPAQK